MMLQGNVIPTMQNSVSDIIKSIALEMARAIYTRPDIKYSEVDFRAETNWDCFKTPAAAAYMAFIKNSKFATCSHAVTWECIANAIAVTQGFSSPQPMDWVLSRAAWLVLCTDISEAELISVVRRRGLCP